MEKSDLEHSLDYREILLAQVNQWVTKTFKKQKSTLSGGKGTPRSEVHFRGGRRIGVIRPDGGVEIMGARDIVHQYDALGRLVERHIVGKPPVGYRIMAQQELNEYEVRSMR